MKQADKVEILRSKLRWLRLPGMLEALDEVLVVAQKRNLTPVDLMDQLCDAEKQSRIQRAVARRISYAKFPEINTVDAEDPIRPRLRSDQIGRGCHDRLIGGSIAGRIRNHDVYVVGLVIGELGGALIFSANDGSTGVELWQSDGSDGGLTSRVRSTAPG